MLQGRSKLVVAILVAGAGLGAAAWSIGSLQRRPTGVVRQDVPRPGPPGQASPDALPLAEGERRVVHAGEGDGPGPAIDPVPEGPFDFKGADSDTDYAGTGFALEERVTEVAGQIDWLDRARGDYGTIAEAARLALLAPVNGREAFDAAVGALKGDATAASAADLIVSLLEGAMLDLAHLSVEPAESVGDGLTGGRPPAPSGGEGEPARVPMMMRVERGGDGPDDEQTTVSIPMATLFPQAADEVEEGQKAVEVRCPARLAGMDVKDGRAEVGVVLIRERGTGIWQPVAYNLYSRDREAASGKVRAMRQAREGR
jgi:hypothetical protein